jgi:hypothetical protein
MKQSWHLLVHPLLLCICHVAIIIIIIAITIIIIGGSLLLSFPV